MEKQNLRGKEVYSLQRFFGSCLLRVMSIEIAVDVAVDTRSIVGRYSVDSRSI